MPRVNTDSAGTNLPENVAYNWGSAHIFLCPWRTYVVNQLLASASVCVRVCTIFKFSKICIVF